MNKRRILITGATGFIGRRLTQALSREGVALRCLCRRPVAGIPAGGEYVVGDLLRPETLVGVFRGVDTAYYLVHSLDRGPGRFVQEDRRLARNFVTLAEEAKVRRVIYLSGLGDRQEGLSEHLESRQEVADILCHGKFKTTVLRAAIIVGAGGASFELIRFLVRTQPLLPAPDWLDNRCQPIAVADVLAYLVGCLGEERTAGETFDIGGPEILTYRQMLERFAIACGDVNLYLPLPFALPRLAVRLLGLVSPLSVGTTESLLEGLKNEVVCRDQRIRSLVPITLTPYEKAVRLALAERERGL